MRRCYIVVRQVVHYKCEQDNPVVEVFTTLEAAKDLACRIINHFVESSNGDLHMVESTPDSVCVYKVSAFDCLNRCESSYSVIKKGMMV